MTNPTRTCNARRPLVRSEFGSLIQVIAALGRRYISCVSWGGGRGGRIRTGDLLNPIQCNASSCICVNTSSGALERRPDRMLGDALQAQASEWLALREAEGLRPNTIRSYSDHIHIFLKALAGRELTPFTFAAFFRDYAKGHSIVSC